MSDFKKVVLNISNKLEMEPQVFAPSDKHRIYLYESDSGSTITVSGYGYIYNWYAVQTGKLAPDGWHVSTDAEWQELVASGGGWNFAGGALKETGTTNWSSPNYATNLSGFTALPGGIRGTDGKYADRQHDAYFWTSTIYLDNRWYYLLFNAFTSIIRNSFPNMEYGMSVRCVKNDSNNLNTVTDYDGNIYKTIKIGDNVWMDADLRTTHYNDGTEIPYICPDIAWSLLSEGGWCIYDQQCP